MANKRILRLTQFSILLALELILGFTPIGMIMVPPVSITLMHIPVIICGIVLGPAWGGVLGGSFGLIAMFKATTQAVSPADILFSPFISGQPLASLVMVMVPRILVGVFAALLYRAAMRLTREKVALSAGVSAVLATMLHTVMVLGCFWAFFDAIPLAVVFTTILTLNGGLEILAAALVAVPLCPALVKVLRKG